MKPVYHTKKGKLYQGDCLEVLRDMPEQSINCVVTSPPYWGLRDYNVDGQLGLESTPEEYVQKMVEIFREVWRVLRDDGTVWLNLGDSYGAVGGDIYSDFNKRWSDTGGDGSKQNATLNGVKDRKCQTGLRPKNLVGIPWRVAFALQSDGWYLRQDIIWSKPNPMPESVTDRCTKSHEYIFLLSKNERYYYDAEAVKEPASRNWSGCGGSLMNETGWHNNARGIDTSRNCERGVKVDTNQRNKRSVWTINTMPYGEAHFAVFPPKLPKLCIKAGCSMDGTVLDPFFGSGTVGMVAQDLGRSWVGIELNSKYCEELVKKRVPNECQGNLMELCAL